MDKLLAARGQVVFNNLTGSLPFPRFVLVGIPFPYRKALAKHGTMQRDVA